MYDVPGQCSWLIVRRACPWKLAKIGPTLLSASAFELSRPAIVFSCNFYRHFAPLEMLATWLSSRLTSWGGRFSSARSAPSEKILNLIDLEVQLR
jgi:hypothetical protein